MNTFKVTLLGTGTSHGVPVIACKCQVCLSEDPRNRRSRTSAWIKSPTTSLVIDTPPDHREQALRHGITTLDAALITHSHSDHVAGMDDLRAYSQMQFSKIPVYGNSGNLDDLKKRFAYAFTPTVEGGGKPGLSLNVVTGAFKVGDLTVTPVPLMHGSLEVVGWRIGKFAYLTDTNRIPEESFDLLHDLDTLVIDGLRPKVHNTHFNFEQAIEAARRIKPRKVFLTHITHLSDHAQTEASFPDDIKLAYDGQIFEIGH